MEAKEMFKNLGYKLTKTQMVHAGVPQRGRYYTYQREGKSTYKRGRFGLF